MWSCVIKIHPINSSSRYFKQDIFLFIKVGGQNVAAITHGLISTDLFIVNRAKVGLFNSNNVNLSNFLRLISGFAAVFATVCHDAVMTPADGESLS